MKRAKPADPIHPGEILLEDFMKPAGITINGLARELRVPTTRSSAIVNEARGNRHGYSVTPGAVLLDDKQVMDEPAGGLRVALAAAARSPYRRTSPQAWLRTASRDIKTALVCANQMVERSLFAGFDNKLYYEKKPDPRGPGR